MDYKRAIRLIGIIIICVTAILIFSGIKQSSEQTKRIEHALNLSNEGKRIINSKQIVADIRALENGKEPKYAKKKEVKDDVRLMGVQVDIGRVEYEGSGYTIKTQPATDVMIYNFYHDDENLYTVVYQTNVPASEKAPKIIKTVLIAVLYGGLIVAELILCIKRKE